MLRGAREVEAGVEGAVLWVVTRNVEGRRLLLLNIGEPRDAEQGRTRRQPGGSASAALHRAGLARRVVARLSRRVVRNLFATRCRSEGIVDAYRSPIIAPPRASS